jgi:hypothetical protein
LSKLHANEAKAAAVVDAQAQKMGLLTLDDAQAAVHAQLPMVQPSHIPMPTKVANTWQEHQQMVVDYLSAQGKTVASQAELWVHNPHTGKLIEFNPDALVRGGNAKNSIWQVIDAKFSDAKDLTSMTVNMNGLLQPNQKIVYPLIADGKIGTAIPFGARAEVAGMVSGVPIRLHPSVELYVNNPYKGGFDVRLFKTGG